MLHDDQRVLDRVVRWFIAERGVVAGNPLSSLLERFGDVVELRRTCPHTSRMFPAHGFVPSAMLARLGVFPKSSSSSGFAASRVTPSWMLFVLHAITTSRRLSWHRFTSQPTTASRLMNCLAAHEKRRIYSHGNTSR